MKSVNLSRVSFYLCPPIEKPDIITKERAGDKRCCGLRDGMGYTLWQKRYFFSFAKTPGEIIAPSHV